MLFIILTFILYTVLLQLIEPVVAYIHQETDYVIPDPTILIPAAIGLLIASLAYYTGRKSTAATALGGFAGIGLANYLKINMIEEGYVAPQKEGG